MDEKKVSISRKIWNLVMKKPNIYDEENRIGQETNISTRLGMVGTWEDKNKEDFIYSIKPALMGKMILWIICNRIKYEKRNLWWAVFWRRIYLYRDKKN